MYASYDMEHICYGFGGTRENREQETEIQVNWIRVDHSFLISDHSFQVMSVPRRLEHLGFS